TSANLPLIQDLCQDPTVLLNGDRDFIPLYQASQQGNAEIVRFFLGLGTERLDPNITQSNGMTSLEVACESGHVEVVGLLLADQRVEVNGGKNFGFSPFYLACE